MAPSFVELIRFGRRVKSDSTGYPLWYYKTWMQEMMDIIKYVRPGQMHGNRVERNYCSESKVSWLNSRFGER